jgi:hypothetical protein
MCYLFRCNPPPITRRPADEHRIQIRLGGERHWLQEHPVGRDIAKVDTTLLLGVHPEHRLFIGLDPFLYDPLPMGISVEFKEAHVQSIQHASWHVWERDTVTGVRRPPRSASGLETLVGFAPSRLIDYARFEHQASLLGLDPPLRFSAATAIAPLQPRDIQHVLEREFHLSAAEILDLIHARMRLSVAVRGGVAEHHLGLFLRGVPGVASATPMDQDGPPDYIVDLQAGGSLSVECKNVSPSPYANGTTKVEVQKTRASKGDRTSRLYKPQDFDILAACLYPRTGRWEFRFIRSRYLVPHAEHPACIAPIQRLDGPHWSALFPPPP